MHKTNWFINRVGKIVMVSGPAIPQPVAIIIVSPMHATAMFQAQFTAKKRYYEAAN